ncbi:uncharacterized protein DS421_19g646220 [Arachis hypogaea]|uniref:Uncharacterized protein n=1 Tax=Arachis hypogaea TaxID=3818 RepID=A0A6B9V7L6_ARAHY|nr:uncharacterized protein DS421_19g646220 [Arachis hypogaea]
MSSRHSAVRKSLGSMEKKAKKKREGETECGREEKRRGRGAGTGGLLHCRRRRTDTQREREGASSASSSSRPPACHHWFLTVVAVEAEHVEFPATALESAVRPDSKEERCAVSVVQRGTRSCRRVASPSPLPHVATVRAVASNRAIASRTCSAVLVVAGVVAGDPPSLEKGRESEKESRAREEPSRSCPCRCAQQLSGALSPIMGVCRSCWRLPPLCLVVLSRAAVPGRRKTSLPSPENSSGAIAGVWSPLLLEVAAGLLPNRFGDRRCSGLAVPSSVRLSFGCCMLRLELLRLLRKWLGTEVLAAGILIVDLGLRQKGLYETFGLWICVSR